MPLGLFDIQLLLQCILYTVKLKELWTVAVS